MTETPIRDPDCKAGKHASCVDARRHYYYVVVDDTPELPERPLTERQAAEEFLRLAEDTEDPDLEDAAIEIRVCTDEDLEWAGIAREERQ